MGHDIMVDKSTEVSCHILVMLGCSPTIGTIVLCDPGVQWDVLEKDPLFNEEVNNWGTTGIDFLNDFLSCFDKCNAA